MKIFIADFDFGWVKLIDKELKILGHESSFFSDGKSLQIKISKTPPDAIILNLNLSIFNGVQVLKFIKYNHINSRVILIADTKELKIESGITDDLVYKMGAICFLDKTAGLKKICNSIDEFSVSNDTNKSTTKTDENRPMDINDDKFTRIQMSELITGTKLIFDLYIRLNKNKFLKLFSQGDPFNENRVQKYISNKSDYLYFLTTDRKKYMSFMNELASKIIGNPKFSTESKVILMKGVIEKYVEEVYCTGLRPSLLEYSKTICENIHGLIKKTPDLNSIITKFELECASNYSDSFLKSIYSVMILKNFNWHSSKTIETMLFGSYFHDIGLLKLPMALRQANYEKLSEGDKLEYEKHCAFGVNILPDNHLINGQVKQIIYQHHELTDGKGYPEKINDLKIFPMAKILSFVIFFVDKMKEKKIPPIENLKHILTLNETREKYNHEVVHAFSQIFIGKQI